MTVREAIDKTDALMPNVCAYAKKASLLAALDERTENEFFSYFSDNARCFSGGYEEPDKELLIPDPFSELYVSYLALKTALSEGDVAAFSNFSQLFNTEYLAFKNWYIRFHTPLGRKIKMD